MISILQVTDIERLLRMRAEVIRDVFQCSPGEELMEQNRQYYQRHIPDGSHIAVEAMTDGEVAGCGAVCITGELPSPDNPSGRCGYLMNIYVKPPFRRRGIAHAIVRDLVGRARRQGCGKIYLESTPAARSLYLSSGFTDLKNMLIYAEADK